MVIVAIIISVIALAIAGFAFIRASSSHHILGKRIEDLKERVKYLETSLNRIQTPSGKGQNQTIDQSETGRKSNPKQEQQEARHSQTREERQEPRQKQRQKQKEKQQIVPEKLSNVEDEQPQQPRRKKENRKRNEPLERKIEEADSEQQVIQPNIKKLEFSDSDLLAELEQPEGKIHTETPPAPDSGIRYTVIPEDGVIRQYQLQQNPDSDSYIEIDVPAEGSNQTRYRFNMNGNHGFVISQGMDRLENAFDFEKPLNRMVTKVVQQQDGVLIKINNGWRIQEKARIDFR